MLGGKAFFKCCVTQIMAHVILLEHRLPACVQGPAVPIHRLAAYARACMPERSYQIAASFRFTHEVQL